MRHLIWYLRSAFCKHEWEYDQTNWVPFGNGKVENVLMSATCKKCGWHRKYNKF